MPLFFVRKMYMSTSVFNIQTVDAAVPALKANLPVLELILQMFSDIPHLSQMVPVKLSTTK